jgi:hypothetical protein
MVAIIEDVEEGNVYSFHVVGSKEMVEIMKLPSGSSMDRFHQIVMRDISNFNEGRWEMASSIRDIHERILKLFREWERNNLSVM